MINVINYSDKFKLGEDEILILKHMLEKIVEYGKPVTFHAITRTGNYELQQDSAGIVEFCKENTRYTRLEEIVDIMLMLEHKTNYFKMAGTIGNNSSIDIEISPIGVVKLFSIIQEDIITVILEKMSDLYNADGGIIKLSTNPKDENSIDFADFYEHNKEDLMIPFSIFKSLFFGLKELGYIDGSGNITSLQATDLKLTGLGIRYLKDLQEKLNTTNTTVEGE